MLDQLPMYQSKGKEAYRPNLSRMKEFCSYLNSPEKKIKTIHIAGTNGKGSTAHMIYQFYKRPDIGLDYIHPPI